LCHASDISHSVNLDAVLLAHVALGATREFRLLLTEIAPFSGYRIEPNNFARNACQALARSCGLT
jgi:hypothetical protein